MSSVKNSMLMEPDNFGCIPFSSLFETNWFEQFTVPFREAHTATVARRFSAGKQGLKATVVWDNV